MKTNYLTNNPYGYGTTLLNSEPYLFFNLNGRFIYFMNVLSHIMQSTVHDQLKYNPVSRLGLCAMMNAFVKQTV